MNLRTLGEALHLPLCRSIISPPRSISVYVGRSLQVYIIKNTLHLNLKPNRSSDSGTHHRRRIPRHARSPTPTSPWETGGDEGGDGIGRNLDRCTRTHSRTDIRIRAIYANRDAISDKAISDVHPSR